jgi:hypothetical protein
MNYIFSYYDIITETTKYVVLHECPSFPYSHKLIDPDIKSNLQDGYRFMRPRFTKTRKSYSLKFLYLIDEDKRKLEELENNVRSCVNFTYYPKFPIQDPNLSDQENVAYAENTQVVITGHINFELAMRTKTGAYWNVSFIIEEC